MKGGGLFAAPAEARSAEIARLAAEAARALGCEGGLEAAEAVLRAGLLKLGGSMLGQLLSADPGQRGPRLPCGQGHEAEFTDYRDKTFDTVLGPVTLNSLTRSLEFILLDRKDQWLARCPGKRYASV